MHCVPSREQEPCLDVSAALPWTAGSGRAALLQRGPLPRHLDVPLPRGCSLLLQLPSWAPRMDTGSLSCHHLTSGPLLNISAWGAEGGCEEH